VVDVGKSTLQSNSFSLMSTPKITGKIHEATTGIVKLISPTLTVETRIPSFRHKYASFLGVFSRAAGTLRLYGHEKLPH
jgi:hypothetical protein